MTIRLDKLIAEQAAVPRKEATRLIRVGLVRVDGQPVRDPATKVDPTAQAIALSGQALTYREHLYLMLNKPAGLLCVSRDPKAPTVLDLVPPALRRRGLFPAGRLDKDTTGLVLLTDDGDWAHRLTAPKKEIYKVYRATLDAPVTPEMIRAFAAGTALPDGTPCRPARLTVLEPGDTPLAEIAICEGKYHQVKRMFGAHGIGVLSLCRLSIGGLTLDENLPEGECRELTDDEKTAVFSSNSQSFTQIL